jgi:hypothetical protein
MVRSGRDHHVDVLDCQREWLLAEHRRTGRERRLDTRAVAGIRCRDDDGLGCGFAECVEIGGEFSAAWHSRFHAWVGIDADDEVGAAAVRKYCGVMLSEQPKPYDGAADGLVKIADGPPT